MIKKINFCGILTIALDGTEQCVCKIWAILIHKKCWQLMPKFSQNCHIATDCQHQTAQILTWVDCPVSQHMSQHWYTTFNIQQTTQQTTLNATYNIGYIIHSLFFYSVSPVCGAIGRVSGNRAELSLRHWNKNENSGQVPIILGL